MGPVERALEHIRSRSEGGPVASSHRVTLNFHPDVQVSGATMIELLAREGLIVPSLRQAPATVG